MAQAYAQNLQHLDALNYYTRIKTLLENQNRPSHELLKINNNLGYTYNHLQRFEEAIKHFQSALDLLDERDFANRSDLSINIGVAYFNLGEFKTSIDYFLKARKLKAKHQPEALDHIDQLIATAYLKKQDFHNALEYAQSAEAIALANENKLLLVDIYYTSALIYSDLYEYDNALEDFQQHLRLRDSFALEEKFRQQQLLQQHIDLERSEKQIKLFLINEEVKELTIAQLQAEADNRRLELKNKEAQLAAEQKEKEILQKDNELQASKLKVQESETQRARQELELARQNLKVSRQEKALQSLELKNKEAQLDAEQKEKKFLLQEKELSQLALEKQKERTQFLYGLGGLLALILLLVGGGLLYYRRLNQELHRKNESIERQKKEISEERKKSDNLLLNILPEQVALELKDTGKATTKKHENVTILFTDFKDFTKLVASIPSSLLVSELNDIFSRFDDIMERHAIEKIETIGDAYLAACGLPEENTEHAIRCVNAAFEMLSYLNERNKTHSVLWNMRVGIHSGPVVAGVVGKKKFAYDLFGDAVNTASRIETNGEAGKVNISNTTYELIKHAPGLSFEHRGEIHAKGKGLLTMWFVGNN
jgi:class 3 adenylate cyclase